MNARAEYYAENNRSLISRTYLMYHPPPHSRTPKAPLPTLASLRSHPYQPSLISPSSARARVSSPLARALYLEHLWPACAPHVRQPIRGRREINKWRRKTIVWKERGRTPMAAECVEQKSRPV